MRVRLRFAVALCFVAVLYSCQAITDDDDGLGAKLEGREFISQIVTGHELVPGTEIRLGFHGGEVSFYAGCNHHSGSYGIEGNTLGLLGLGSTEIGCDAPLHAQDEWLSMQLQAGPRITLDGDKLTLRTSDAELVFLDRTVASPDRPLVGTRWVGNGHGDSQAVTFDPGSAAATAFFGVDGFVDIFTACQHGTGDFSSDASNLSFHDFGYDGAPCGNPALSSTDHAVTSVLDGSPVTYEVKETNLTIHHGELQLMYRADE